MWKTRLVKIICCIDWKVCILQLGLHKIRRKEEEEKKEKKKNKEWNEMEKKIDDKERERKEANKMD